MKSVCTLLLGVVVSGLTACSGNADINTKPLPVKAVRAFPNLRFDRPIVVTHANDGSDRVFVAGQKGLVHVFPNQQNVEEAGEFIDIRDRVVYNDKQNEEGLLGFAFHPQYKKNGEFFVYYTTKDAPQMSVISRFTVSKDDPNVGDPKSEQEILRIPQPFWNHNGGTIAFGPDGYLYVALGDGGKANDPFGHGQNLETLLGSILRIDIDKTSGDKQYAIPADNPFVNKAGAQPEIYAYGLRNVWRMSFDRKTGALWAADVGQNLWEEINIIRSGGNYGWNIREAKHKFDPTVKKAAPTPPDAPQKGLIDPIFEYHHDIGKSITGGEVYRGKKVPALQGKYVYADYVTSRLWGLNYNAKKDSVTANQPIDSPNLPVMSFGSDEHGELYFTTVPGLLYTFAPAK